MRTAYPKLVNGTPPSSSGDLKKMMACEETTLPVTLSASPDGSDVRDNDPLSGSCVIFQEMDGAGVVKRAALKGDTKSIDVVLDDCT